MAARVREITGGNGVPIVYDSVGAVKVEVRKTWPLKGVAEAHNALESRQPVGSSILLPTPMAVRT